MKISIFQPTYLPWLGFFKAIDLADKFVFLDDVQFEKHSWQSRNRIKTANGELMMTVPIIRNFPQLINEVKINYAQDWVRSHLKSIQMNYCKAPFFSEVFPRLESIYNQRTEKILDLNINIIKDICDFLEIKTEFIISSDLGVAKFHKNEKIAAILEKLGATQYFYAPGSAEYMKAGAALYKKIGVELISLKLEHPVYPQLHGKFISYLSIIDLLFNCGKEESVKILKNINL
jgi:hypothetical protein